MSLQILFMPWSTYYNRICIIIVSSISTRQISQFISCPFKLTSVYFTRNEKQKTKRKRTKIIFLWHISAVGYLYWSSLFVSTLDIGLEWQKTKINNNNSVHTHICRWIKTKVILIIHIYIFLCDYMCESHWNRTKYGIHDQNHTKLTLFGMLMIIAFFSRFVVYECFIKWLSEAQSIII